ncbi:hypothetical protein [Vulcanisaeta distributa]|uniref:hypothetical protein n=1 Tax=Vulcanisaeta distributa TaxID=164451 RepID=UPI0006CF3369|nr:hypothetical protein [Vulcanisaeta distributa]
MAHLTQGRKEGGLIAYAAYVLTNCGINLTEVVKALRGGPWTTNHRNTRAFSLERHGIKEMAPRDAGMRR